VDRNELAELYRQKGVLVFRRCKLILRDDAAAEDVMQEVFVRVWKYRDSLAEGPVPLSWLYRTAERCCFDRLKSKRREHLGTAQDIADTAQSAESEGADETVPVASHSERDLAMRFFDIMDPKLKQLALLYYVDQLTQEQIAEQLSWSRRTVGKKIKRLRERAERLSRRSEER